MQDSNISTQSARTTTTKSDTKRSYKRKSADDEPEDPTVILTDYSEKSIGVFGNTYPIKDHIMSLGGKFNKSLKFEEGNKAGWILSKLKRVEFEKWLRAQNIPIKGDLGEGGPNKKGRTLNEDDSDVKVKGEDSAQVKEEDAAKKEEDAFSGITIITDYTSTDFAVVGNTRDHKSILIEHGGVFNLYIDFHGTRVKGYLVPTPKLADVMNAFLAANVEVRFNKAVSTAPVPVTVDVPIPTNVIDKANEPAIFVVDYSQKSIAVYGETVAIKNELMKIGGKYNRYLTYKDQKRPGWIVPKKLKDSVQALIDLYLKTKN
ncbi:hypothetical protein HDU97_005254 [Phlyctochytrium planicorne]|nr:hypothetical protein HDU97_005254 [Phlyctochytrium planicorne]